MEQKLTLRRILTAIVVAVTMTMMAKDTFTALEQQQISIATKGLFDKSDAFTVDFDILKDRDYSFPLPVGKAKLMKDNQVEITTTKGDAVKSMFSGVVRMSKHHAQYGNVIVVRHDNGLETVYAYHAQNLVAVGDRVKAGQTIAIVGGENGRVFCLFSIMVNGNRINPETILSLSSHRLLRQVLMCRKTGTSAVEVSVVRGERDAAKYGNASLDNFDVNADPFGGKNTLTLQLSRFSDDEWAYPLPGAKVISAYGSRGRRAHTGVDIKTKANDNIYAAFDGIVTMSQSYAAYGKCIRIKHPCGIETLYSHNSKNLVNVGDKVKAGQLIALTGRTGRATTEHLHFECRVNGRTFDPSKIFNHQTHSLRQHTITLKRNGQVIVKAEKGK